MIEENGTLEEPKYCAACGKLLVRRIDEPPYRWRQRRTCGKACGTRYGGTLGQGGRVEAWIDWDPEEPVNVDGEKLKSFVGQLEDLGGQIDVLLDSRRDLYREAKRDGLDPTTIKVVMRRRRQGEEQTEYMDAMLQAYEDALSLARAHASASARGTSCDPEEIVKRPFQISEFIKPVDKERLMAGR